MHEDAEKTDMETPVADVRRAPLSHASAPGILDRLRSADKEQVPVAAFGASI